MALQRFGYRFYYEFICGLPAFEETSINLPFDERPGTILGSLISGVIGFLVLRKCLP
ncbi:MAG: hypothetical protein OQK98_07150 [Gammaproteobacteria bacterium]|nr:hypothetical protein [Gammaproteobacteria bacterium]